MKISNGTTKAVPKCLTRSQKSFYFFFYSLFLAFIVVFISFVPLLHSSFRALLRNYHYFFFLSLFLAHMPVAATLLVSPKESEPATGADFLSLRIVLILNNQPIRFNRKCLNRRLLTDWNWTQVAVISTLIERIAASGDENNCRR